MEIDLIVKLCLIGGLVLVEILIWLFCESELKKMRSMLTEAETKIGEEKPEEAKAILAKVRRITGGPHDPHWWKW